MDSYERAKLIQELIPCSTYDIAKHIKAAQVEALRNVVGFATVQLSLPPGCPPPPSALVSVNLILKMADAIESEIPTAS